MVQGADGKRGPPHRTSLIKWNNFQCDDGEGSDGVPDSTGEGNDVEYEKLNSYCTPVNVNFDIKNYIVTEMFGRKLSALIDSGADENTILIGMVKHLFDADVLPEISESPYKHVTLADGCKRIRVLGQMSIVFSIGGRKFEANFHIKETEIRLIILGNRFVRNHESVIDFKNNLMKLKPSSKVKSCHTVVLPPMGEIRVEACVEHFVPDGQLGIIEPVTGSFCSVLQVNLLASLSRVQDGKVLVRMKNRNCYPVRLKKGDVLRKFMLNEESVGKASIEHPENTDSDVYEIEKIIKAKHFNGSLHYLCKWKGYGSLHNSYEPENNLNQEAKDYIAKNPVKIIGRPKTSVKQV